MNEGMSERTKEEEEENDHKRIIAFFSHKFLCSLDVNQRNKKYVYTPFSTKHFHKI